MSSSNSKILTLKEASDLSGVAIPTLRMRLKKGLIEGVKKPSKFGEVWYLKANSIKEIQNIERIRLKCKASNKITSLLPPEKLYPSIDDKNPLVEAQKRHIDTLEKQMKTFEGLLADFQARINILESDKLHLECQMKRLPAPLDTIPSRLEELEKELQGSHLTKMKLADELMAEKNKPWWKKLLGLK